MIYWNKEKTAMLDLINMENYLHDVMAAILID